MLGVMLTLCLTAAPQTVALPKVAALEWSLVRVDRPLGDFFADHFSAALRQRGLQVVTSKDIGAILGQERQKQLLGCSEGNSCLAELGNALGCEALLLVSLARLDDSYRGSVRLVSSNDAKVMAETPFEAANDKGLLTALDEAAGRLAEKLGVKVPEAQSSLRQWSWVPAVAAAVGVGCAVGGFAVAASRASSIQMSAPGTDVSPLVEQGKTAQTLGWVGAGVGVAGLVAAGVMFFSEKPAVTPVVQLGPTGASVGLTGAF